MTELSWPTDSAPSDRWPIYTRGNIGEVYPDVVLPLEWDLGGVPSEMGWRRGAETIGFITPNDYGPGEFVMIGVFGGYAYFNASLMRLLGVRAPGLAVDVIDTQFLGDAEVAPYRKAPGDRNLAATLKVVRSSVSTLTAKSVHLVDEMRVKVDAHRSAAPSLDASDDVLFGYIEAGLVSLWEYLIAGHVINTMQATIAAGALTDLCEKRLGDPNLALTLTSGIGDVVSARPAQEMWKLANDTAEADFDARFARFLTDYGHRGPNEFSMAGRDWSAYPELATAAISTMRGADQSRSPAMQERRMADARVKAMSEAKAKLGWRSFQLERAVKSTVLWSRAREESKNQVIRANQPSRHAFLELLRRAAAKGGVEDRIGPLLLDRAEFLAYLADPGSMVQMIEDRRATYDQLKDLDPPFAFDASVGGVPAISTWDRRRTEGRATAAGDVLVGAAGAPGMARGRIKVITDPADPRGLTPGEVLVAPHTDPSWTPLFVTAAAVIVEVGAAMSHSMIVSRELGIPCVVGVDDATLRLTDGAEVEVDGGNGRVTLL